MEYDLEILQEQKLRNLSSGGSASLQSIQVRECWRCIECGAVFSYFSSGFLQRPTDHYFRPYFYAIDNSQLFQHSRKHCFGNRPIYEIQLELLEEYLSGYSSGVPRFALQWHTEPFHTGWSEGAQVDGALAAFLGRVKSHLQVRRSSFPHPSHSEFPSTDWPKASQDYSTV